MNANEIKIHCACIYRDKHVASHQYVAHPRRSKVMDGLLTSNRKEKEKYKKKQTTDHSVIQPETLISESRL